VSPTTAKRVMSRPALTGRTIAVRYRRRLG
jgi:hypothetical protein